jgi:hypothetical protein
LIVVGGLYILNDEEFVEKFRRRWVEGRKDGDEREDDRMEVELGMLGEK